MTESRVTLADIGRAAGVSGMVASSVLNHASSSTRVSEATRKRVLEAAERLGYRSNPALKRALRTRSNSIGIAMAYQQQQNEAKNYLSQLVAGIYRGAAEFQLTATALFLPGWKASTVRVQEFATSPIDCLVLLAPQMTDMLLAGLPSQLPVVAIHGNHHGRGIAELGSDESGGGYTATRHLIELGHERIMYLCGHTALDFVMERITGYRRALGEAGLPIDEHLIVPSFYSSWYANRALEDWMSSHQRSRYPTAVICGNDSIAQGAMTVLRAHGLSVPDDVSVIGWDDTYAMDSTPHLTTIRQPLAELGYQAVHLALDLLMQIDSNGSSKIPPLRTMPVELVVRGSTARAKPRSDDSP